MGPLAVAFFAEGEGIFYKGDTSEAWQRFGIQLIGILAITAWTLVWSVALFGALRYLNLLRVPLDIELQGVDVYKHGEVAYPEGAWQQNLPILSTFKTDSDESNGVMNTVHEIESQAATNGINSLPTNNVESNLKSHA